MNEQQLYLYGQIQTSQTGGQLYSVSPPYGECSQVGKLLRFQSRQFEQKKFYNVDHRKRFTNIFKRRSHPCDAGDAFRSPSKWQGVDREHGQQLKLRKREGWASTTPSIRPPNSADDSSLSSRGQAWNDVTAEPLYEVLPVAQFGFQLWWKVRY